jgi:hypothetical protein
MTLRNTVLAVTNEVPPADLIAIPAGAKLIESRAAKMLRMMRELGDMPASQP